MSWRQTLGFIDNAKIDLPAVQSRYLTLRHQPDRRICESRRLKQAMEAARRELTPRSAIKKPAQQ